MNIRPRRHTVIRLILLMCLSQANHGAVIFWDVGYTLVAPSISSAFRYPGLWSTMRAMVDFAGFNVFRYFQFKTYLQNFYVDTLRAIPSPVKERHNFHLLLPNKEEMPAILNDFMIGDLDGEQARACINTWVTQHPEHFMNKNHAQMFVRTAEFAFSTHLMVDSMYLLPCAQLLKQCNGNGKHKHVCIILSNWARCQIPPFIEKFSTTIMTYIDSCIFSCDGYGPKPCTSIYQRCSELVRTKFSEHYDEPWFFIDDQQENLDGAKQYMGHELICALPTNAAQTLKDHGIIA